MSNFELRFTYLESPWAVASLFALAAALAILLYVRCLRRSFAWQPLLLTTLRFLAVATLLVLLLRPILRFEVVEHREERLIVLLDTSQSMGIADSVEGETRLASALRVTSSEALERLAGLFHLELYTFSTPGSLRSIPLPENSESRKGAAIRGDGYLTDLAASWGAVSADGGTIGGFVLLSDGRDHGPLAAEIESPLKTAVKLPSAPVYAVGLGSGEPEPADLAWTSISAERKALRGSRVEVRARITNRSLPACATAVTIRLDGREIARRALTLEPGARELKLELVPERTGRLVYEFLLEPHQRETSRQNNKTYLVLDVADRPLQILFFDGRARWEYKFARRAIGRDPNVSVTGVVALSGDRLLQQGEAPVRLEGGLPASRQDWKAFDVLVLGNVGSEETIDRVEENLLAWISKDGGGLVYAGGAGSHRLLGETALGNILPVDPGSGIKLEGPLVVVPELPALEHPVTRGLLSFFPLGNDGEPLTLGEAFASGLQRPGSERLLSLSAAEQAQGEESPRGAERHTLLATRQYGAGRIVQWFTESDWRWVMNQPEGPGAQLFNILWGRMVRWAARRGDAAGSGSGLELSKREARVGEEVLLTVFGGERLKATRVVVTDPSGAETVVPGTRERDRWTGRFVPALAGVHTLQPQSGGEQLSRGKQILIVHPDNRELEQTAPDWDLLRRVAERTGGRFLTIAEAATLAEKVVDDNPGMVTHVELGTERSWGLYLALVAFLTLEWILRRRIFVV